MRVPVIALLTVLTLSTALSATATGPSSRYNRWGGGDDNRMEELLLRLNKLIDEADKARAADRYFLRDLRELVRDYHQPWGREILHDDFYDGDYTRNPAWTVTEGSFWIDRTDGLRSSITRPKAKPKKKVQAPKSEKSDPGAELAIALLGGLLGKKSESGTSSSKGSQPENPTLEASRATIQIAKPITNAFSIKIELTSLSPSGELSFGPFQRGRTPVGYRLAYRPGDYSPLELLRVGNRGTAVIDAANKLPTAKRGGLSLEWTRTEDGEMRVAANGKELFKIRDRSLRDNFDGIEISNSGGDFAVREIVVYGVR